MSTPTTTWVSTPCVWLPTADRRARKRKPTACACVSLPSTSWCHCLGSIRTMPHGTGFVYTWRRSIPTVPPSVTWTSTSPPNLSASKSSVTSRRA